MTGALSFTVLHVRDLAAASAFYAQHFGLDIASEAPGFVQLAVTGGSGFGLERDEKATENASVEMCWAVADADAQCEAMRARGVRIVSEPKDMPFGRAFTVLDPDGNALIVYQRPA
ncbi:MAG TPA: VOC family protein [Ktedonobacterales bacterium]